jgi:hypothetical protein
MNRKLTTKNKKELKAKMAAAFEEKIKALSPEYQKIFLDDMVTAFENRLTVMARASSALCTFEAADIVELENA